MVFRGDQPPRIELLPRALAGHVMAQVEQPGNLARQGNPAYRLATLILIRCGLRVSDALKLPFDCTVTDDAGAPYLRYRNNKMKREALVPVDDELLELIRGQQQRVLGRYPPGAVLFPRPEKNPDGKTPVSSSTYRLALYRWLELCDVCDEHGRPVRLTPHQWRHTLGTVLKMSRIASDASFGRLRERALPAAQLAGLRCTRRAGVSGDVADLELHRARAADASMMRLALWRGMHRRCTC
jgi:integrase